MEVAVSDSTQSTGILHDQLCAQSFTGLLTECSQQPYRLGASHISSLEKHSEIQSRKLPEL